LFVFFFFGLFVCVCSFCYGVSCNPHPPPQRLFVLSGGGGEVKTQVFVPKTWGFKWLGCWVFCCFFIFQKFFCRLCVYLCLGWGLWCGGIYGPSGEFPGKRGCYGLGGGDRSLVNSVLASRLAWTTGGRMWEAKIKRNSRTWRVLEKDIEGSGV